MRLQVVFDCHIVLDQMREVKRVAGSIVSTAPLAPEAVTSVIPISDIVLCPEWYNGTITAQVR